MASQEEPFRQLQAEMERRAHPPSDNADDIDRHRRFTAALEVTLAGATFPLRPEAGLIALFTYVSRGSEDYDSDDARGMAQLAAMYDLLHASVVPKYWDQFERHAVKAKVLATDLEPCIRQLIEAYTARPYMAGMRLLATAAHNMAELDGAVLLGTGRGIANFTAREVCNLMLTKLLTAMPGENERDLFLEDLYLDYSPEDIALGQVAQMMAEKAKQRAAEEAAYEGAAGQDAKPQGDTGGLHDPEGGEDRGVELPAGGPAGSEPGPAGDQPGAGGVAAGQGAGEPAAAG